MVCSGRRGRYGGYTLLGLALQQRLCGFPGASSPGFLD